jgi:hypothetical protein
MKVGDKVRVKHDLIVFVNDFDVDWTHAWIVLSDSQTEWQDPYEEDYRAPLLSDVKLEELERLILP